MDQVADAHRVAPAGQPGDVLGHGTIDVEVTVVDERPRARRDELLRERPDVEPRRPRQLLTGVGVRATFDGDVGGPPVPDDGGHSSRRIHPDAHVFAVTGAASRAGSSARSGSWSIGRSTSSTTNAMTNAFSVSTWNTPT